MEENRVVKKVAINCMLPGRVLIFYIKKRMTTPYCKTPFDCVLRLTFFPFYRLFFLLIQSPSPTIPTPCFWNFTACFSCFSLFPRILKFYPLPLELRVLTTVEPRFNKVAWDRPNLFVKSRVRYIENLDITNLRGTTKMFVISRS